MLLLNNRFKIGGFFFNQTSFYPWTMRISIGLSLFFSISHLIFFLLEPEASAEMPRYGNVVVTYLIFFMSLFCSFESPKIHHGR